MAKVIKYTAFKTKWGYFGLAGTEKGLLRTHLPLPNVRKVKSHLLKDLQDPRYEKALFKELQEQIIAYFEGFLVNFQPDLPLVLDGSNSFANAVLTACRNITFGQTTSYAELARKMGQPAAARGVGRVMAKNPLPLIIPCHRVIRSDGKIGGFSAPGGAKLKNRLLQFEQQVLQDAKQPYLNSSLKINWFPAVRA